MNLLLDTHALLWWLTDDSKLSATARAAISDPEAVIHVSAISVWEISIKRAIGKLTFPGDPAEKVESEEFAALPITFADATTAGALPRHHQDPFDRMLIAQAMSSGLQLVTRDPIFSLYDVDVLSA